MPGRFDRRFAYQFEGGDWGDRAGWTPPWMRRERRGPGFFASRLRRGLFGPGGPFGHEGPFGPGGPGRFFGRGDMKYALLELLQDRPMYGYEMIKALEEKSGGFYSPSAGSIYPTLQLLEDRGMVSVSESEGKKVYSITEAGRTFLGERNKEREEEFSGAWWGRTFGPGGRWNSPELQALRGEAMEVARLFTIAGRMSLNDQEKLKHLHTILEATRKELSDMIYGANQPPKEEDSSPTP
jgi:DNA-binding PadR family transcriptional regulator